MRIATITSALAWLVLGLNVSCASVAPHCGCARDPEHPGCTKVEAPEKPRLAYLLAEARFAAALGTPREVEISQTPAYHDDRAAFKSVAVRPPDNCLTQTASEVQGEAAAPSTTLASQKCGVWLSEIEKGLVRSGFRVVSWDALRTIEENERVPPYKAAQKLGADVLFLFNSLELSPVAAGGESAYRIEYFDSDARGRKGVPAPMTEAERTGLRSAVMARSRSTMADGSSPIIAGILDATAIHTSTGESIWFYRNTELKTMLEKEGQAFLFVRMSDSPIWYLEAPRSETVDSSGAVVVVGVAEQTSAVDSGGRSVAATHNQEAVERLALMRAVTADFVDRFRTGKGGDNDG